MATHRFTIVGIGEAVFDIFPDRVVLGGAPLNVAVHAHQLAQRHQGRGVVVSRVGQDALGEQLLSDLRQREMTCDYVQSDPDHATGQVYVSYDENRQPSYEIAANASWDWLQYDPDVETLARRCDAVCFGSLAQREGQARNTIHRFLDDARRAYKLFDVNLRPPFVDASVIRRSCEAATAVKLNEEELATLTEMLGLAGSEDDQQVESLLKKFELRQVILTRGAQGTTIYTPSSKHVGEPTSYPGSDDADAVGAGDACVAAILVGTALRLPADKLVQWANHVGAYVASQPGATPNLPDDLLNLVC